MLGGPKCFYTTDVNRRQLFITEDDSCVSCVTQAELFVVYFVVAFDGQ